MGTTAEEGLAEQAKEKASTVASATQDVAQSAAEQVGQVASEAATQAKDLLGEARDQLRTQAEEQARKLVGTLRSTVDELRQMASSAGEQSTVKQLVQGLADKGSSFADGLESKGPGALFGELQSLGRRRPGVFLFGALAAGVTAGRLGRAAMNAPTATPSGTAGAIARSEPPVPTGGTWDSPSSTSSLSSEAMSAGTTGALSGPTSSEASGTPLPPRGRQDSETVVLPTHGHRTQ